MVCAACATFGLLSAKLESGSSRMEQSCFALVAFFCTQFFVVFAAPQDPCTLDDNGLTVNCSKTTEEEGCPTTDRYDERMDPTLKCCCPCPSGRCTDVGRHDTQCHSVYCKKDNSNEKPTVASTGTTGTVISIERTTTTIFKKLTSKVSTAAIGTSTGFQTTIHETTGANTGGSSAGELTAQQPGTWPETTEETNNTLAIVLCTGGTLLVVIAVLVGRCLGKDGRERVWKRVCCIPSKTPSPIPDEIKDDDSDVNSTADGDVTMTLLPTQNSSVGNGTSSSNGATVIDAGSQKIANGNGISGTDSTEVPLLTNGLQQGVVSTADTVSETIQL